MARHAAPRSPSRRRAYLLGCASVLGLAATVAIGVLVAPTSSSTPIGLHWPTPTATRPAPTPAPPRPAVPTADTSAQINVQAVQAEALQAEEARIAAEDAAQAQAEADRQAAEDAAAEAKRQAQADADRKAKQAAEAAASATTSTPSPRPEPVAAETVTPVSSGGTYQDYALQLLGGDRDELSALEKLWDRESGWNPNAQNTSSTAYGIPQLLDSTWAATGIAKTPDPLLQIQAGLAYINERYGSPSAAWAHSQATGWY